MEKIDLDKDYNYLRCSGFNDQALSKFNQKKFLFEWRTKLFSSFIQDIYDGRRSSQPASERGTYVVATTVATT